MAEDSKTEQISDLLSANDLILTNAAKSPVMKEQPMEDVTPHMPVTMLQEQAEKAYP